MANTYDGTSCPECLSSQLDPQWTDSPSAVEMCRQLTCRACGASWLEWYVLDAYSMRDRQTGDLKDERPVAVRP